MKVIAVNGITKSGKTTVCETIISGLREKGFTVGSVKEIHNELFKIDPDPQRNTNRHKIAGSQLVIARGLFETDVLYQSMLPIEDILKHFNHDYVILEGVTDLNCPRILTGHSIEEIQERKDERCILVSGVLANQQDTIICGLPVINCLNEKEKLVDFVIEHAINPLPNFDPDCCDYCGYNCNEFTNLVISGKEDSNKCIVNSQSISLTLDGKKIDMVPFVEIILKNNVLACVKELDGFKKDAIIEIKFKS